MKIDVSILCDDCTDCEEPATHQASQEWENGSAVRVPVCAEHGASYEANGWTVTAIEVIVL